MDGRTESQTDTELRHSNLIFRKLNKVIRKVSAQYVKARRRKVQKKLSCISSVLISKRGITPTKINAN